MKVKAPSVAENCYSIRTEQRDIFTTTILRSSMTSNPIFLSVLRHGFKTVENLPWKSRRTLRTGARYNRPSCYQLPGNHRAFSGNAPRRFAEVNTAFDPRQQEREADEVDVCIVGGGKTVRELSEYA